ncbi:hypothetical protein [Lentilactobacillus sp. SPB1-3]|uniref:Uncharacterized protein n=1 Tax=Lentilactobacillus terminaliae TaxID=3003483 RepID=A0ACD5DD10_9LACO|nr:hypothetical protein [Lentilactobacillus sp. SPB1-3]MCZ0978005.1 hypothetical protein [Lentilactobacillus sp. SPB1-3]
MYTDQYLTDVNNDPLEYDSDYFEIPAPNELWFTEPDYVPAGIVDIDDYLNDRLGGYDHHTYKEAVQDLIKEFPKARLVTYYNDDRIETVAPEYWEVESWNV